MGSPTLRLARLALYFAWTLSLMPVQVVGLAVAPPVDEHAAGLLSPLVLSNSRLSDPSDRHADDRRARCCSRQITSPTPISRSSARSFRAPSSPRPRWRSGRSSAGSPSCSAASLSIGKMRSTAIQRDAISKRLAAGDALILFPEGTSGDGNRVLPFKSALFAAASAGNELAPGDRPTGFARLCTPRRNTDRARSIARSSPGTAPSIWRPICGAWWVSELSRWSSNFIRRLSSPIAAPERRSPTIAMRGSPAAWPVRCSVGRSRCRNRRARPRALHFRELSRRPALDDANRNFRQDGQQNMPKRVFIKTLWLPDERL